MKALGIIRNIDNLGRVVIPKEIRRIQGWEEGQPMEMFMDGDQFIMRAYGKQHKKTEALEKLQNVLQEQRDPGIQKQLSDVMDFLVEG